MFFTQLGARCRWVYIEEPLLNETTQYGQFVILTLHNKSCILLPPSHCTFIHRTVFLRSILENESALVNTIGTGWEAVNNVSLGYGHPPYLIGTANQFQFVPLYLVGMCWEACEDSTLSYGNELLARSDFHDRSLCDTKEHFRCNNLQWTHAGDGGTSLIFLYRYVLLEREWFSEIHCLNRVYSLRVCIFNRVFILWTLGRVLWCWTISITPIVSCQVK